MTLARLASRAHGVVTRAQLLDAGVTGKQIEKRLEAGSLLELDSYRYHRSRHAWEQDRRREREAHARGDEFRRYTYGDVVEHPAAMLSELRALLG
jgi:hypothetical protein